jgi:hypothetical protein
MVVLKIFWANLTPSLLLCQVIAGWGYDRAELAQLGLRGMLQLLAA